MTPKNILILLGIPVGIILLSIVIVNDPKLGQNEVERMSDFSQKEAMQNQLPTDTDAIQLFYQAINEKNTEVALSMLVKETLGDEATKQIWKDQFESFNSIELKSYESLDKNSSDTKKVFRVILNADPSEKAKDSVIPYYGYVKGENIRWVTLVKGDDSLWRVQEIATGE